MTLISFGNAKLELRCAGTIYWPDTEIMIVSDLHLEKGSSFSLRGFFLPPHDTRDTLARLESEILAKRPRLLILLGDSFHDAAGYDRLNADDRAAFDKILSRQETIWIHGNHEKGFVPDGVEAMDTLTRDDIVLRHEAADVARFEISGHYHPKAALHHKGHRIRGRCFALSARKIIMPSFGSYTGGLSVTDAAVAGLLGEGYEVALCAESRVFRFPSTMLDG